jgi:hypothetical protein
MTRRALEMNCSYRIRPMRDIQEWNEYFAKVRQPHLMQSYAYGEAKKLAQNWHIGRYVFERLDMPVAICQVLEKRLGGLQVGARINRGPLFLNAAPTYETKANVLRLVRDRWRMFRGGPLLIAPALEYSEENRDILRQLGYRDLKRYCHCSALIDLLPEESEMKKQLAQAWRNRLQSCYNRGLELRVSNSRESVEWMLAKHEENMRRKNFRGPSKALVAALYEAGPRDFLVLQAFQGGEPIAGLAVTIYGHKAECYVAWIGESGRRFNCGNFLFWNAAMETKKIGCQWLDLGGYYSNCLSSKFVQFKCGMRGTEYRLIGDWLCY